MNTNTKLILMLLLIFALVVLGPIVTIWSLNTLFPALAIPTTLETWFAVIILGGVIRGESFVSLKGKK
jgi:hypothetical protein